MWNPDQIYEAEQVRRAELEVKVRQMRLLDVSEVTPPYQARAVQARRRLAERLSKGLALRPSSEVRR